MDMRRTRRAHVVGLGGDPDEMRERLLRALIATHPTRPVRLFSGHGLARVPPGNQAAPCSRAAAGADGVRALDLGEWSGRRTRWTCAARHGPRSSVGQAHAERQLRHTFASLLVALGTDPGAVMDQLGHEDAAFTLRVYRHGPPPRSFADLRTGFALQCTQAGVPLQELASWLGVSLRTVEPLAAFTPHSDPARRIAAAFGGFE